VRHALGSVVAPIPAEQDRTAFLAALSEEQLKDLLDRGVRRRYLRGTTLFHQDDPAGNVVVLLSGRAKVSSITAEGKEVVLSFRGPGEILGEVSAVDGEPRSATVSALEPIDALVIPGPAFKRFVESHDGVALAILRIVTRRLRDADRQRVEFAAYDTIGRIGRRLVELAAEYGKESEGGIEIDLPLSQEELAGWTGSSREAATKALHVLRELGWIETRRRRITVLDLEALRRLLI
jgi:CRP/FNR family cyclic AMP-dependent transcriptional regulator